MTQMNLDKTKITQNFLNLFDIKLRQNGRYLKVIGSMENDAHLPLLNQYLQIHPEIVHLDLSNTNLLFKKGSVPVLNQILQKISHLTMNDNPLFTDTDDLSWLEIHYNLIYLEMSNTYGQRIGLERSKFLSKFPELKSLIMVYAGLSMNDKSIPIIHNLEELEELNIQGNQQLSDEFLINFPPKNKITTLDIRDCPKFTDSGIDGIAKNLKRLGTLHLNGTNCSNGLKRSLEETNIHTLTLSRFNGSHSVLSKNPNLTKLTLGSPLTWAMGEHFLSNLTLLHFDYRSNFSSTAFSHEHPLMKWKKNLVFLQFLTGQKEGYLPYFDLYIKSLLLRLVDRNQVFLNKITELFKGLIITYLPLPITKLTLEFLGNPVCDQVKAGSTVCTQEEERRREECALGLKQYQNQFNLRCKLVYAQLKCIYLALGTCIPAKEFQEFQECEERCPIEDYFADEFNRFFTQSNRCLEQALELYALALNTFSIKRHTSEEKRQFIIQTIYSKDRFFSANVLEEKRMIQEHISRMPDEDDVRVSNVPGSSS